MKIKDPVVKSKETSMEHVYKVTTYLLWPFQQVIQKYPIRSEEWMKKE